MGSNQVFVAAHEEKEDQTDQKVSAKGCEGNLKLDTVLIHDGENEWWKLLSRVERKR